MDDRKSPKNNLIPGALMEYIRIGRKYKFIHKSSYNNKFNKKILVSRGKRKGILISFTEKNQLRIGWSLCNKKNKFDSSRGITIAYGRGLYKTYAADDIEKDFYKIKEDNYFYYNNTYPVVPPSIKKQFNKFIIRSEKYFKIKYEGYNV